MAETHEFKPFVAPESNMKEFTLKALLMGSFFGVLFGAANVYLALRAGLTVSASIPIAVMAITIGRKIFKTTILENNIIQTTGSAGESIASGVVFTLPGFLFLSTAQAANYFDYVVIFILAMFGGMLGTLMMIPLRRSLIVKEHATLPYPEGTACASVLKAGEKGGAFARMAFQGLGFAFVYAILQKMFRVVAETVTFATGAKNRYFPSANLSADITPEYLGVGYIIGPRIAGVLVAGGVLSWLVLIPLLSSLIPDAMIAQQQLKLGLIHDLAQANKGSGGWNPLTQSFANKAEAIYRAYIRQIGAGAVAAGGFITLIKTIPTIITSFRQSIGSIGEKRGDVKRTDRDLDIKVVLFGSIALIVLMAALPMIPGNNIFSKLLVGLLVIVFGAFFVTVSSRIVGLIGSSNNPISGMTIATVMSTCLIFVAVGWSGKGYEAMALVVGGMVCIAAANAGATSQDLKTGYLVGATPRYQQLSLFVGAVVSAVVIGFTVKFLDKPTAAMAAQGIQHGIGTVYNAPQATLMATLIKGILSFNLDWNFVIVGAALAIVMELCGIKSLSFAVGAYLPLSTTLPIFIGGVIRGAVDHIKKKRKEAVKDGEEDLESGNLYATGLVAGGALMGVIFAFLQGSETASKWLAKCSLEPYLGKSLGEIGFYFVGVAIFALMAYRLYRAGLKRHQPI